MKENLWLQGSLNKLISVDHPLPDHTHLFQYSPFDQRHKFRLMVIGHHCIIGWNPIINNNNNNNNCNTNIWATRRQRRQLSRLRITMNAHLACLLLLAEETNSIWRRPANTFSKTLFQLLKDAFKNQATTKIIQSLVMVTRACCRKVKIPNQYSGLILWCLFMYRIDPWL